LCVPASEYILKDILYYVFGLLDKEISLKKYLEEVCSKVIELMIMSYTEWEKEYQVAQESLTFNEFPGYTHPNLPVKPPKSATITERVDPKPTKLDGARTNNHTMQVRAIIGHIPCILTVQKSYHQWQLIALPLKVPPYDLAVYLSDKVGSQALTSHIKTQILELGKSLAKNQESINQLDERLKNLPSDIYFTPTVRTIETEKSVLEKISGGINKILVTLDQLLLNIRENRLPSKASILESTQILQGILKNEHIKHESSYSDDYYRYHVLGNLKIVEEVETVNPTYTLTVLGSERDTRRSQIPSVINWLRRVPSILQKHFKEDYPTNDEIKSHLMSVYPFYKRRVREGDKIDKSYVNLESEMIIRTKGKLIIEIYFNGDLQTTQLLAVTKPIDGSNRQGKIPVKISSTVGFSIDALHSFLKCTNKNFDLSRSVQNTLNAIMQKFVSNNIRLFTREREEKIVQAVSTKDILGFSGNTPGLPQVLKQFKQFTIPFTSDSEVELGKMVNLLTLQEYDQHDTQALFEVMCSQWKKWSKTQTLELGGFTITRKNPGDLMAGVFHKIKHNQDRSQIIWGDFINDLFLLSKLPIGFRTNEGVILTPWDLLSTHKATWEYRIKVQLIDIFMTNQPKYSIESLLQLSVGSIEAKLNLVFPDWKKSVSPDVTKHLEALYLALNNC